MYPEATISLHVDSDETLKIGYVEIILIRLREV